MLIRGTERARSGRGECQLWGESGHYLGGQSVLILEDRAKLERLVAGLAIDDFSICHRGPNRNKFALDGQDYVHYAGHRRAAGKGICKHI